MTWHSITLPADLADAPDPIKRAYERGWDDAHTRTEPAIDPDLIHDPVEVE